MDIIDIVLSKKYTDESLKGITGTLAGKNCTIKSATKADGVTTVVFAWTADDGTEKITTIQVNDGAKGEIGDKGDKGDKGDQGEQGLQGIQGLQGEKGDKGEQGIQGIAGTNGKDGITYVPQVGTVNTVNSVAQANVTVDVNTEEGRATFNFDIPKGKDGVDGTIGKDGVDGFSPVVTVTATNDGHNVSIEDKNGIQNFDIIDGKNGTDGFSPTVEVTEVADGHTITITDKNSAKNFKVTNGKDGVQIDDETVSETSVWSSQKTSSKIAEKVDKTDIVTTIDGTSTDTQVPSAKAVWNKSKNKIQRLLDGVDIIVYADSISHEMVTDTVRIMNATNSPYGVDNVNNDFYYTIYNVNDDKYKRILAYDIRKNDMYMIVKNNNIWGAWAKLATMDKVAEDTKTANGKVIKFPNGTMIQSGVKTAQSDSYVPFDVTFVNKNYTLIISSSSNSKDISVGNKFEAGFGIVNGSNVTVNYIAIGSWK